MPRPAPFRRPAPAELDAALGRTIPDVIGHGLDVLFCGINPGRHSGATGFHFAGPGNRFWKALRDGGFTDRVLLPSESRALLDAGCGITNLVARTTATAAELSGEELRAGRRRLERKVRRYRPRIVAVAGVGAYRQAFRRPGAMPGPQAEDLAGARLWVLPNPSGLNASYQAADFAAWFRALRQAAGSARPEG